jgi:superoxide dismutase, Fe-Mn family
MFILPDLPYPYDALSPALSADTLQTHHGKHHKAYVDKANELAAKAGLAGRPLEEVVREARRRSDDKLFNNAAQAWNHAFFWECMTPQPQPPGDRLAPEIERAFGSFDAFAKAFAEEGVNHFASGWVWLVTGPEGLQVISTHDADDVLVREGLFPLLVCDLWEHAYYLDYKNDRPGFLKRWLAEAANWGFAERQLEASSGRGEVFRYPAPVTEDAGAPDEREGPRSIS